MRTPEEILEESFDNSVLDLREITSKPLQAIFNAIEQAQKEAYNEAIRDAVDNAEADDYMSAVEPDSILKLIKP